MVEFKIKFDKAKADKNGKDINEIMNFVVSTLKQRSSTVQIDANTWIDDSENALVIFGNIMETISGDNQLFDSLEYMMWNVDGEIEDCIIAEKEYREWKKSVGWG